MHILLIVPRYSTTWGEFYQFPLGLGYVAAAMKRAGHKVSSLNLNHQRGAIEELVAAKVREYNPDICATGGLSPFLSLLQEIFSAARRAKPDIINIAGGGAVSGEPGVILDVADIDIGVIGEGEITIVELLACLERQGRNLQSVQGIVFKDKNLKTIQTEPRPPIKDLSSVPWPDYEALQCEQNIVGQRGLDSYFLHSCDAGKPKSIDMITSRSCPFRCKFCFHPTGKVYRERPLDDVFAEIDYLVSHYKVNMIGFIDELFSLRRSRLLEFCERIRPYNLKWMIQLHVLSASEEVIKALKSAGCTYISYGIESMNQTVLNSLQKKSNIPQIEEALDMTYRYKIGIQGNLIFGDAAETLETANESMHWWAANRKYQVHLTPLMVFPGSPHYLEALRDGLIGDSERADYVRNIPEDLNISSMNDKNAEMLKFQVWVFLHTLLNLVQPDRFELSEGQDSDRGSLYDIVWKCPRCGHKNDYLSVILPPDNGASMRITCRDCNTRWDIANQAYQAPVNSISQVECQVRLATAKNLLKKGDKKGAHDLGNGLLSQAPNFVEARQFMGSLYRLLGIKEHMVKSFGVAVGSRPFSPDCHCDFADALLEVEAAGAARMHYAQALQLQPGYERAIQGLALIDAPTFSDDLRKVYFVSWSDDLPPRQKIRTPETLGQKLSRWANGLFSPTISAEPARSGI